METSESNMSTTPQQPVSPGTEVPDTPLQSPTAQQPVSAVSEAIDEAIIDEPTSKVDKGKARESDEPEQSVLPGTGVSATVTQRSPSPVFEAVPEEGLTYPPRRPQRRDGVNRTPAVPLRAAEAARVERAGHLVDWLERGQPIEEWVREVTSSPELLTAVISLAQQRATEQAEAMRLRYESRTDSLTHRLMDGATAVGRSTSAWTDVKPSEEFRNALRQLELHDDPQGTAPLTLDLARDVLHTLRAQINELRNGTDGLQIDQADLEFMQRKTNRDIDALIGAIGETAYDKVGWDRAQSTAAVAATLLVGVLPFAYAYYSEPTAFFYLGSLAGAYSRTLALASGLMLSPATGAEQVLDQARERQLIWAMPALFYSVQAYMQAYASDHPENQAAAHLAEKASNFSKSVAFLSVVGLAESVIFIATNHPDWVQLGFRKTGELVNSVTGRQPSRDARFQRGDMRVATPADGTMEAYVGRLADIRSTFRLAAGLTDSVFQASDRWQGNLSAGQKASAKVDARRQARGEELTEAEQANLREANGEFEKLGEAQKAKHTQAKQALGQLTDTLEQFVGQIKEAVPLITAEQKREKQQIGRGLLAAGAVLGTITSLAALKTPALLTDYIPYYAATELLLGVQMSKDTLTPDNLVRTFGSYFGGTTMALPTSLANLVTNLAYKEGLWDLVTHKELPSTHHPSLPVTEHPQLYAADGKVNFGIFVAYNVITALAAGGAAGQWVSNAVIDRMAQAVDLNQQAHEIPPETRQQVRLLCDVLRARQQQELLSPGVPGEAKITELPGSPPVGSPVTLPSSVQPQVMAQGTLTTLLNEANVRLPFGPDGRQREVSGFNDCGLNVVVALDPTLQELSRNSGNSSQARALFQDSLVQLAREMVDTRGAATIGYDGIQEEHLTRLLQRRGIDVHAVTGLESTPVATQLADANQRQERLVLTTGQQRLEIGGHTLVQHHFVPLVPAGEGQWVLLDPIRRGSQQEPMRVTTEQLATALSVPGNGLSRVSPQLQLDRREGPSRSGEPSVQDRSAQATSTPFPSPERTRMQSNAPESPGRGREAPHRPGSQPRNTPAPGKSTTRGRSPSR